jgi:hypothetical protein
VGAKRSLVVVTPAERDTVLEICNSFKSNPDAAKFLLLIPRSTAFVEQVIQSQGFNFLARFDPNANLQTQVVIKEFHADFVPVDVDFFLMPCVRTFYQYAVENDYNDIFASARSLAKIQTVFGTIPRTATIGENAKRVFDSMQGILAQTTSPSPRAPQIDSLIIIDRMADLVTPLTMTFSFEGLADDVFGISFGTAVLPVRERCPEEPRVLTEDNICFSEIRYLMIDDVMDVLSRIDSEQSSLQGEAREAYLLQVTEYEQFVGRTAKFLKVFPLYREAKVARDVLRGSLTSNMIFLRNYEKAAIAYGGYNLLSVAENLITIFDDWEEAMRLICLDGATRAISDGQVTKIQREIVAEFGIKALDTVVTLEKLKVIAKEGAPSKGSWQSLVRELKCYGDRDPKTGGGAAQQFLFNCDDGRVPPTVRVVEHITKRNLGQKPTVKVVELFAKRGIPVNFFPDPAPPPPPPPEPGATVMPHTCLVFFVGGVTLPEVADIRHMGRLVFDNSVKFIVGATNQLNRKTFIRELCPNLFRPLERK